jgi:hypothetical protein
MAWYDDNETLTQVVTYKNQKAGREQDPPSSQERRVFGCHTTNLDPLLPLTAEGLLEPRGCHRVAVFVLVHAERRRRLAVRAALQHVTCETPSVAGGQMDRTARPGPGAENVDGYLRRQGRDIDAAPSVGRHRRGRFRVLQSLRCVGHAREGGGHLTAPFSWQPRLASAPPSHEIDDRELVTV